MIPTSKWSGAHWRLVSLVELAIPSSVLGLPIVFEEPGNAAVMDRVAVHDPSEGPVNTCRLYFLVNDPPAFAERAAAAGVDGSLRVDGYGQPAWESVDPFGNSVVILKRRNSAE